MTPPSHKPPQGGFSFAGATASPAATRNTHVLFVHGVGRHSRLASLMQAYQSLRASTRSAEAPMPGEDRIRGWRLDTFADDAAQGATPRLKLVNPDDAPGQAVFLYEVNYSTLAGIVRANQPLDLTQLFVGFDLALNAARTRLAAAPPLAPADAQQLAIDHVALAQTAQKIAGVLVALTMPVLGLPSLALRRFTHTFVDLYSRFFEDIATFAIDMNGQALISAHFQRTLCNIVESEHFARGSADGPRDRILIAAHSLGSVVAHDFIVRHRFDTDPGLLPDQVLTFGSPIGLVCWLWLLLDFERMDFTRMRELRYFAWDKPRRDTGSSAPARLHWINVCNRLDPIATAFPADYLALSQPFDENRGSLIEGLIHQRYIHSGGPAWEAHTRYFDDKAFLEILGRAAGLRTGMAEDVMREPAAAQGHWLASGASLQRLRLVAWAAGAAAVTAYLAFVARLGDCAVVYALLPLYLWPALTVGTLAFFQRLLYSRPTKRTSAETIAHLPWRDIRCRPHCMRQQWRRSMSGEAEEAFVLGEGPGWFKKGWLWFAAFLPSLGAMLLPVTLATVVDPAAFERARVGFLDQFVFNGAVALVLFTIYLIAMAVSEFAAHWKRAIEITTRPA